MLQSLQQFSMSKVKNQYPKEGNVFLVTEDLWFIREIQLGQNMGSVVREEMLG